MERLDKDGHGTRAGGEPPPVTGRPPRVTFPAAEGPAGRRGRVMAYGTLGLLVTAGVAGYLAHLYRSLAPLDGAAGAPVLATAERADEGGAPVAPVPLLAVPASVGPATSPALPPPPRRRATPAAAAPTAGRAAGPTDAAAPPSPIAITRGGAAAADPLLAGAYAAFRQGDDAAARAGYEQALRRAPRNRAALLGLAAVAVRRGEATPARALYRRLLERDPADPLARAGLLAQETTSDPVARESALKLLIAAHPDAPPLYHALGNLYAAMRRWGDARQAYVRAWETANPRGLCAVPAQADYAFNLAVALDHLGRADAALHYYRCALAVARPARPAFDPALAGRRIAVLQGTREPPP